MKDKEKKQDLSKVERISDEVKRLNRQFTKIDSKTKKIVKSLIENAAFMTITLEDLWDAINTNGCVCEYQNGENQWGTKKSPEVEIYNTMIKNHSTVIKLLTDMIPKDVKPQKENDGFDEFVNSR
ncbi:hypothetical protein [Ruminiclostridium papyrosolvens]|uniref:Uncharacterized protein n=1 Tax=Ruminiclostridium papyrosolvens C7 TaxID=1330534 RepID=U4R2B9_9FIRM|nr:hypothetical protein [Ruminiclostridium papyrosolvens]EPR12489.1 hypothetical protein L323_08015 [Ruminiclostridium papyrosolvens C7]